MVSASDFNADSLTPNTKLILEEVTRYLNMEKLLPCYHFTVTVSCLSAIRKLQKFGHLPSSSSLFRSYSLPGQFVSVRCQAVDCLVDFVSVDGAEDDVEFLLNIVDTDSNLYIRHYVLESMISTPPFTPKTSTKQLNTRKLAERLWKTMNSQMSHDHRLRCAIVDLYYVLYGTKQPSCYSETIKMEVDEHLKLNSNLNLDANESSVSAALINWGEEPVKMDEDLVLETTTTPTFNTEIEIKNELPQTPDVISNEEVIDETVVTTAAVTTVTTSSSATFENLNVGLNLVPEVVPSAVVNPSRSSSELCSDSSHSLPDTINLASGSNIGPSTLTSSLMASVKKEKLLLDSNFLSASSSSTMKSHKPKRKKEKKKKHKHKHKHKHDKKEKMSDSNFASGGERHSIYSLPLSSHSFDKDIASASTFNYSSDDSSLSPTPMGDM